MAACTRRIPETSIQPCTRIALGHNLLDGISAKTTGSLAPAWHLLYEKGSFTLPGGWEMYVIYPLVPWPGVMLPGYAAGELVLNRRDWFWLRYV
ncbi:MAG TPA: hypothetical protein VF254_03355 [Gammaproteobacteria bacterium]